MCNWNCVFHHIPWNPHLHLCGDTSMLKAIQINIHGFDPNGKETIMIMSNEKTGEVHMNLNGQEIHCKITDMTDALLKMMSLPEGKHVKNDETLSTPD